MTDPGDSPRATGEAEPWPAGAELFGHPTGLFTLFFAEMWERFSYYGMRALLVFYMIKGFLGYGDHTAYAVYGAYTALVYMTPFFGGMLADRLLGRRRAVVLGGLLMAAGHLLMTVQDPLAFYTALALLIAGNGFFKPNISTMVGALYPAGSGKRDGGFTIFYMGINLGAAMAPLLCGYIGETYGWHYGFGLATVGMLTGIAVFVMPVRVTQILIMLGAAAGAFGLFCYHPDHPAPAAVHISAGVVLLVAGIISWVALERGGLPAHIGAPPDPGRLRRRVLGGLVSLEGAIYAGTLLSVPLLALFVSGFLPFTHSGEPLTLVARETIEGLKGSGSPVKEIVAVVVEEMSKPAGLILLLSGLGAALYLIVEALRLPKVPRERMFVVFVLTFFSLLFWSFFEQAGSSVNNFTDRNVDRVFETRTVGEEDVGKTIELVPTQEQLGYHNGAELFTMTDLMRLRAREEARKKARREAGSGKEKPAEAVEESRVEWVVTPDDVGMGIAERRQEIPASTFQSVNPSYILIFGLVLTVLWGFLRKRGVEPSTPLKFAAGLTQLGLGFGAFWLGARYADARGMVRIEWLLLGYLLHTTGELCLSPVGLSMVTKLSPRQLVSTVMGSWFLATAFSQYLAAIISQFTGVTHGSGGETVIPEPSRTVNVYGDVFGKIALAGIISGAICLVLVPVLKRWMHEKEPAGA